MKSAERNKECLSSFMGQRKSGNGNRSLKEGKLKKGLMVLVWLMSVGCAASVQNW